MITFGSAPNGSTFGDALPDDCHQHNATFARARGVCLVCRLQHVTPTGCMWPWTRDPRWVCQGRCKWAAFSRQWGGDHTVSSPGRLMAAGEEEAGAVWTVSWRRSDSADFRLRPRLRPQSPLRPQVSRARAPIVHCLVSWPFLQLESKHSRDIPQ